MTTVEELQGIVAGLTPIVKQQAEAQKATNTQIANLTEALLAHPLPSVKLFEDAFLIVLGKERGYFSPAD